jgi:hypothetical protein
MKKKEQAKVKGITRVKKFNADQDETVDEPVEVLEREFDLTEDQLEEVKKGKKIEIVNGKPQIK